MFVRERYAPPIHDPILPPKYKEGDILRYDHGSTALMQITYISKNHGGYVRYYGQHCMGGSVGAYEWQTELASEGDKETWESNSKWRRNNPITDKSIVGAVED